MSPPKLGVVGVFGKLGPVEDIDETLALRLTCSGGRGRGAVCAAEPEEGRGRGGLGREGVCVGVTMKRKSQMNGKNKRACVRACVCVGVCVCVYLTYH